MGGAVLGALSRRGEAVAAAERGYSGAPWRTAVAAFGTAAVPSAAVLRGCCGSTTRCAAARAGSARLVRGRGGCYARYGAPPCGARTEGHSVVVWVLKRPRSMMRRHTRSAPPNPDRTADAEPPNHSPQPIAPTTDGPGAGVAIGDRTWRILCGRRRRRIDAIRVGCRRDVSSNGLGGTLPPELGRLTDLVNLYAPFSCTRRMRPCCDGPAPLRIALALWLGRCSRLALNKFTGTIGSWIDSISKLTYL